MSTPVRTTAQLLSAYHRQLTARGLSPGLVDDLVCQAAPTDVSEVSTDPLGEPSTATPPWHETIRPDRRPTAQTDTPQPDHNAGERATEHAYAEAPAAPQVESVQTTAGRLAAYRGELQAAGISPDIVDFLLRDAGRRLHEDEGLAIKGDSDTPATSLTVRLVPKLDEEALREMLTHLPRSSPALGHPQPSTP